MHVRILHNSRYICLSTISLSLSPPTYLPMYLSVFPFLSFFSSFLSIHSLPTLLTCRSSVHMSVPPTDWSIYLIIYLAIHPSRIYLLIYPSIHSSLYPSTERHIINLAEHTVVIDGINDFWYNECFKVIKTWKKNSQNLRELLRLFNQKLLFLSE